MASNNGASVVWKWKLDLKDGPQSLMLPTHSRLVHTEYVPSGGIGRSHFLLWFEFPVSMIGVEQVRWFQIFGTGDEAIPGSAQHRGTGISWDYDHRGRPELPRWVWHLYQIDKPAEGL